jgi:hypothetical protein
MAGGGTRPVKASEDRSILLSFVSDPKLGGMVPLKLLLGRLVVVSFMSDPKLDGTVPFKPLSQRSTAVIPPFTHVTHMSSSTVHNLPPHAQGSSLSDPHDFQVP